MEGPSQTAISCASFRAAHMLFDREPIFEDPYALRLLDASEAELVERLSPLPASCAHVARLFPAQRARFTEQALEDAVARGVRQYVMLGAGLDSFAWRRADLMGVLDLYEVDHPASQEWKRDQLQRVGLPIGPGLHFVGVDFAAQDDLGERLVEAGFDPTQPSFWAWLGVTLYLPVPAIEKTLRAIADLCGPGSELVASYGVTPELMDPCSREFDAYARAWTAGRNEPQITFFTPEEIERIALGVGFSAVERVPPERFDEWFAGRTDRLKPVSYEWLVVASMRPPLMED